MHPRRTSVAALALALLSAAALLGGAGHAAVSSIGFSLTGSPPAVTPGKLVGYSGTITNSGPDSFANAELVENIHGIGPLRFQSFSRPVACVSLAGGGIRCGLGTLAPHDTIRFTTVFELPAATSLSMIVNSAFVTDGHSVFCANATCGPSAVEQVLPVDTTLKVGGYLGFPTSPTDEIETDQALSPANPHATGVDTGQVGNGVGVVLREGSGTTDPDDPSAPPSFFQCPGAPNGCIGQWSFVGIPETEPPSTTPFTQANPFEVTLLFSRFEQPHDFSLHGFSIYKNGVKVTDACPFDAGSTVCVKSITQDHAGTIVARLLETVNGYVGGG